MLVSMSLPGTGMLTSLCAGLLTSAARNPRPGSEDPTVDRENVDWRGYIPAITTPFDRDGELSIAMLDDLLDWLMAEGMHGIVVAGTTGEWFSLRPQEKVALFDAV